MTSESVHLKVTQMGRIAGVAGRPCWGVVPVHHVFSGASDLDPFGWSCWEMPRRPKLAGVLGWFDGPGALQGVHLDRSLTFLGRKIWLELTTHAVILLEFVLWDAIAKHTVVQDLTHSEPFHTDIHSPHYSFQMLSTSLYCIFFVHGLVCVSTIFLLQYCTSFTHQASGFCRYLAFHMPYGRWTSQPVPLWATILLLSAACPRFQEVLFPWISQCFKGRVLIIVTAGYYGTVSYNKCICCTVKRWWTSQEPNPFVSFQTRLEKFFRCLDAGDFQDVLCLLFSGP